MEYCVTKKRTVHFHTLGCKLNFSETSTIAREFIQAGFERVSSENNADVLVVNTCSVTDHADRKLKGIVKRAIDRNPDIFVVVIGCYAQLKPKEIAELKGVDLVLGATEKFNVLNYLNRLDKRRQTVVHSCEIHEADVYKSSYSSGDRTRAFLKVQDGCDYKCTYCTIPLARGRSRSDSLNNIIRQANEIVDLGIKEIVLTGVNTGDYGKGEFGNKKHEHTLLDLIQSLDRIQGIERIRISSIEPNLLHNEIIDFVARSKKFMPHFHIPLQSGSNEVLALMKRRYRTELFTNRIQTIKRLIPHSCIGVDVIAGFPGESESHFQKTYNYLLNLPISYLHVFKYSERDNTEAITLPRPVCLNERKKRSTMLRSLSAKKRRVFYESMVGETVSVLFENENRKGYMYGFSEEYIRVKTYWNPELANQMKNVRLLRIQEDQTMDIALEDYRTVVYA